MTTGPVERPVPYDLAAEEAVLGSLLLDRDSIIKIAHFLKPSDFHNGRNGVIYQAVRALYERREPPDPVLLHAEIARTWPTIAVPVSELVRLVNRTPTYVHLEHYAGVVKAKSTLRQLISAGCEIAALGYDEGAAVDDTLARAGNVLAGVHTDRGLQGAYSMGEMLNEWQDRMDLLEQSPDALVGVGSGFADLDAITGGWQRSHLVVLGGRTGHGKTALMCNMALSASSAYNVGFLSLEMSREELVERWVSERAGVDSRKLKQGKYLSQLEHHRIGSAIGRMADLPIFVDDTPGVNISELRTRAYRMKAEHDVHILFVDYIQKIEAPRRDGNRVQEVGEVARKLKDLARELNVPVVAGAQLNRASEGRTNHVPMLSDLRESGDIEHEANIVVFIHRPEMYGQDEQNMGVAQLHVAKNRSGPLGQVNLRYEATITKFQPLARVSRDYEAA